jgi:single-strand DNA-binding protein
MNTLKNKVNLIGNLGARPDVREVASGRKVARMVVATHSTTRTASGERDTNTQWHTVVAWGRTAEQAERLLEKGSPVALEGRLVHRSYADRDGRTRHISEIVLNEFRLLPSPKRSAKVA